MILDEYIKDNDHQKFWRLGLGDHLNLLDEAIERIEKLEKQKINMIKPAIKIMQCGDNIILQINKNDLNIIKMSLRHYGNEDHSLALLKQIENAESA